MPGSADVVYGTADQWTTADPVLPAGWKGVETDRHRVKVGDGATVWTGLPYQTGQVVLAVELPDIVDLSTVFATALL